MNQAVFKTYSVHKKLKMPPNQVLMNINASEGGQASFSALFTIAVGRKPVQKLMGYKVRPYVPSAGTQLARIQKGLKHVRCPVPAMDCTEVHRKRTIASCGIIVAEAGRGAEQVADGARREKGIAISHSSWQHTNATHPGPVAEPSGRPRRPLQDLEAAGTTDCEKFGYVGPHLHETHSPAHRP